MSFIAVCGVALGRTPTLPTPPWSDRESWLALAQSLQPYVEIDAARILDPVWDELVASDQPCRVSALINIAARSVTNQDDLRRVRSIVPQEVLDVVAAGAIGQLGVGLYRPSRDELADSHVHAGGAVPFSAVLDALLRSRASVIDDELTTLPQDRGGTTVSLANLVFTLELCILHLRSSTLR